MRQSSPNPIQELGCNWEVVDVAHIGVIENPVELVSLQLPVWLAGNQIASSRPLQVSSSLSVSTARSLPHTPNSPRAFRYRTLCKAIRVSLSRSLASFSIQLDFIAVSNKFLICGPSFLRCFGLCFIIDLNRKFPIEKHVKSVIINALGADLDSARVAKSSSRFECGEHTGGVAQI